MAIIQCPSCNKSVSDKVLHCPHCHTPIAGTSLDDIERHKNLRKFNRVQNIQTQSMIAMLMFIGGFGVMFWAETDASELKQTLATATAVIGFCWYIVNRIRLIFIKKGV